MELIEEKCGYEIAHIVDCDLLKKCGIPEPKLPYPHEYFVLLREIKERLEQIQ
jgi:hypothetical protein